MLIHLLDRRGPRASGDDWPGSCQGPVRRTADEVATVRRWMDEHGSIAFATEFARGIAVSAVVCLSPKPPSPALRLPARRFVAAMIPYMVERTR